jgi:hypothetical protein
MSPKKARKRVREQLEREQQELKERLEAQFPPVKAAKQGELPVEAAVTGRRVEEWLPPVARGLDSDRVLMATKSSFMIAINCLMLSVTAHTLYTQADENRLWVALIPLALTNVLSLLFAIASAQVRERQTALGALWELPDEKFEPALEQMLVSRGRIYGALAGDLHLHGAALARSHRLLRTAYHVLLGGVVLSAATFALCLLLGTRP